MNRRGNHEVMIRGAFTNSKIKNKLLNREGGFTVHYPDYQEMTIYDAAEKYREEHKKLVIFAGERYGMGSSRDWAAKGTKLLGVEAVIARSFERIHRENLVCMGVLPIEFLQEDRYESLKIDPSKGVSIVLPKVLSPNSIASLRYFEGSSEKLVQVKVRLDTSKEVEYYLSGGIMHYLMNSLIA